MKMDKTKIQTLKGFRDFLPRSMIIRNEVIERLRFVFEKYGFDEIQTPSLEYQEVLLGKYGEEAEKLMYLFEDNGKRKIGLKYDLTVPLARFIVNNQNDLQIPFKRYQIQPVWRADKPQKGRYREFYQCDADIVGPASPLADAEMVAITYEALELLEFSEYQIRINSRKVLFSAMESAKIPQEKWLTASQSIDKLDKKSQDEVEKELSVKKFTPEQIKSMFDSFQNAKPDRYLQETIDYAEKMGVDLERIKFEPILARGLDYYTGPIFETVVQRPKIGSVTGGGRYDNLLKDIGGPDLPAVGTTIGLDRVADVIEERGLFEDMRKTQTEALVTIFSEDLTDMSLLVAKNLRENDINAQIYQETGADLKKQVKYASQKGIPYLIVIGPDEVEKDTVVVKNLETGEQKDVKLAKLIDYLENELEK